jgi:hypothetical protein
MMEKRNKHWRIEQRDRIYAAQMKLYAAYAVAKGIIVVQIKRRQSGYLKSV